MASAVEHVEQELAGLHVLVQGLVKDLARNSEPPKPAAPDSSVTEQLASLSEQVRWLTKQVDRIFVMLDSFAGMKED